MPHQQQTRKNRNLRKIRFSATSVFACIGSMLFLSHAANADELNWPPKDAAPLEWKDDIASRMVDGVDRFLLRKLEDSVAKRSQHWRRDFSSHDQYAKSIEPNRRELAHMLGLRDDRVPFESPQLLATLTEPAMVAENDSIQILRVRWPVIGDLQTEGLLLLPKGRTPIADVVAIPDADISPEKLAGLTGDLPLSWQYARRLAESGCRVLTPTLVSRRMEKRCGRANLTDREFLNRPAFVLGRHIVGYELQTVLAGVDWFSRDAKEKKQTARIGVAGWGEGGLFAFYAAAVDTRINASWVSGYFDSRQDVWQEPIDRSLFGLLEQFGDAEIASLIAPRSLVVSAAPGPEVTLPSEGGAPGRIMSPPSDRVMQEWRRTTALIKPLKPAPDFQIIPPAPIENESDETTDPTDSLEAFLKQLTGKPTSLVKSQPLTIAERDFGAYKETRRRRQLAEIDRHNQQLLLQSAEVRQQYMSKLDTSSLEAFEKSQASYRRQFAEDVIGSFTDERLPPKMRIRKSYDEEKWTGYEVALDVFPDVFAYGILLVPRDIRPGEKRPVVVCQHGLEGRPQDTVAGNHRAYHDYAAKLAERGFVTFAPQNIYIFKDRFRTLQRKAYPLKKTLFSVMVPQHQQITDWLGALPFVDKKRIAFYGLSYGGKSAMRLPALVDNYCLSICSADFNEWVWKNASTKAKQSYVWTGEYEIFEFDLGSTFNYAEMAALIAPRPFMVERGHFDGVAPDETVGYEFAKVRHLYAAKLGLADRCEIEWFVGPHTINGKGTFYFLHRHLDWPKPTE